MPSIAPSQPCIVLNYSRKKANPLDRSITQKSHSQHKELQFYKNICCFVASSTRNLSKKCCLLSPRLSVSYYREGMNTTKIKCDPTLSY